LTYLAGLSDEVVVLLLSLAAGLFTVVGGVGGGLYMAYFVCAGVLVVMLLYFFNAFYMMTDGPTHPWGFTHNDKPVIDRVCEVIQCARTASFTVNQEDSLLTFSSLQGLYFALCCGLCTSSFRIV